MENATKALIIAGGILLAIITISVLLYSFNTMSWFQESEQSLDEMEQINKYNQEYEVFNKKVMFGTDVVSAVNKAISNNEKKNAKHGNEYFVNVIVNVKEIKYGMEVLKNKKYSLESPENIYMVKNEILRYSSDPESLFYNFKVSTFKCANLKYNSYGRISEISFEQVVVKQNVSN